VESGQFDRLSRLVAQSSTRRAAFGLAATLGLGGFQAHARKKRKNKCKGGCGPCQVCKKKKCVAAPSSATCASLGNVCGPVSDGCGGTLTCACGPTATPACDAGRCATCATTCPASCQYCYTRIDGTTRCGGALSGADCALPCSSDTNCPAEKPFCVISVTSRPDGGTTLVSNTCPTPAVCATVDVC